MVSIVIESAKKGSSEQNHIIRVLQLKKEDNNDIFAIFLKKDDIF